MGLTIEKAVKEQVKLKLAITGPSGSGKTYSALQIAAGLGEKILVVDSENGSASLYSDTVPFDTIKLAPPYTTETYREAIKLAVEKGYDVVVLDSISHAWSGEGGLIQQKEALDGTGRGNSYTNWGSITKKQEAFIADILHSDINLIATMRSKMEYAIEDGNGGKKTIRKVGMAPIQRDGVEYEFTTVLDMDMTHNATASKDRTGMFDVSKPFRPSIETGKSILAWLKSGVKVERKPEPVVVPAIETPEMDPKDKALYDEVYALLTPTEKQRLVDTYGIKGMLSYYANVPMGEIRSLHIVKAANAEADRKAAEKKAAEEAAKKEAKK